VALTEAVYYILLALAQEPLHGYGIMRRVEALSDGRVTLAAGTLYGALTALVGRGWIEEAAAEPESRRKAHALTPAGRAALAVELDRLRELVAYGERIMAAEPVMTGASG
jgi:DNA-binding PadR family transcriptional regulator